MGKAVCCTCFKPKATLVCGLCSADVCKYCAGFLEEDSFAFLPSVPTELKHDTYCSPCYSTTVLPQLEEYRATMERAKEVHIYSKNQFKETRFLKREDEPVVIAECDDRDEVTMRLAFQAAMKGLNGVVDVETFSRKVKNGNGYQSTRWSGQGFLVHVDPSKLVRDRSFASQPN